MICTKCGARLMETDQFCSKCGARVIKEKRCPDCGELLRDNVRFCPGCGRAVGGKRSAPAVSDETLDIPIEAIERNILSETEAEIKARRTQPGPRRTVSEEREPVRRGSSGSASERAASSRSGSSGRTTERKEITGSKSGRNSSGGTTAKKRQDSVPAPPPRKRKPVYQEEIWEEDDDWEDDDWDDDEEGIDAITIMTIVAGCVLLVVVAVLGFQLYRQYVPRNYENASEQGEEAENQIQEEGQEEAQDVRDTGEEVQGSYTLTIVSNVNVRDEPSTTGTNVLRVAKAGETYPCHGSVGDGTWYEIELEDGSAGYVFQDYVSVE